VFSYKLNFFDYLGSSINLPADTPVTIVGSQDFKDVSNYEVTQAGDVSIVFLSPGSFYIDSYLIAGNLLKISI